MALSVRLVCAVCKFELTPSTAEEAATYAANVPMHCAQPMVTIKTAKISPEEAEKLAKEAKDWDSGKLKPTDPGWVDAPEALINKPKEEEKPKKKGFFGLGKSKKK